MSKSTSSDPNVITNEVIAANGQAAHISSIKNHAGVEKWWVDKDGNKPDLIINPLEMGGTPYSQAQLEAAIAAVPAGGATIIIPIGTWVISTAIQLPYNKPIVFRGEGFGSILYSSGTAVIFNLDAPFCTYAQHRFKDLKFLGQGNSPGAITASKSSAWTFENCSFENFSNGKAISAYYFSAFWRVHRCYFFQCDYGIYAAPPSPGQCTMNGLMVTACEFETIYTTAIYLDESSGCFFDTLFLEGVSNATDNDGAVINKNLSRNTFSNIYAERNYGPNISFDLCENCRVLGATITGSALNIKDSKYISARDIHTQFSGYVVALVNSWACIMEHLTCDENFSGLAVVDATSHDNTFTDCQTLPGQDGDAEQHYWKPFQVNGDYNTFIGCKANGCAVNGFEITGDYNTFIGCECSENNTGLAGSGGFCVYNCIHTVFIGCRANDAQAVPTQAYGWQMAGTADYITLTACEAQGNTIKNFAITGSHNRIRDCLGYVNESTGVGTGNGSQQTVAHGLAAAPTKVMLSEYTTGGALAYQSAPADATNIYITATNAKTYAWRAEV